MKPLTIVIAIAVLAAIGWYFYSNANAPVETPNEAAPVANTATEPAVSEEDSEMVADDEMHDMDMTSGTDAGMEFPTIEEDAELDAGVDLSVDPEAKVFNIGGRNFEFDVTEIRVQEGDTVTINFTSNDGFHDWVVDEFDAATAHVQTGETSSVTFVADQKGTFEYYCSVGQHRANGMVGTLIVE